MKDSDLCKLSAIQKELEKKYDDFPHNRCKKASLEVEKYFRWKIIVGAIMTPLKREYLGEHFWNYNDETG